LASFLASYHLALPWAHHPPPVLPLYYMAGLWAAIVCCIVFIAIYAWRIGEESRRMQQALAATELVLAREQRLSALDGLAAAAAHQLGTPLSTIALVATEFERDVPKDSPLREDIQLLQTQTARCRAILSQLSRNGRERDADDIFSQMPLSHLLEEIAAPLRAPGIAIDVHLADGATSAKQAPEPVIPRSPGLIHSLGNLVENAADFANARVTIDARYDQSNVSLKITDDGPGFQAGVISHLGEPYVTSRPRGPSQETGMGLGFFIAKTLLERSGASLRVSNRPPPETGALIEVSWPRNRLETAE
jgi:two-component system sensor histidine kinase RegB